MKTIWKRAAALLGAAVLVMSAAGCSALPSSITGQQQTKTGEIGDTMSNYFFDFTVQSAALADSYADYVPQQGNRLLTVEITIENTFGEEIPMWDDDFMVAWGSGDEDYALPLDAQDDGQLPEEYKLADDESRTGLLVFEVPEDQNEFSLSYMEYFDNETEGDIYFVDFTVE